MRNRNSKFTILLSNTISPTILSFSIQFLTFLIKFHQILNKKLQINRDDRKGEDGANACLDAGGWQVGGTLNFMQSFDENRKTS